MPTKNKAAPFKATPPKEAAQNEGKQYSISTLRDNCAALFHVSTSTFDGAATGCSGLYSIKKMRSHINEWLKKEVK